MSTLAMQHSLLRPCDRASASGLHVRRQQHAPQRVRLHADAPCFSGTPHRFEAQPHNSQPSHRSRGTCTCRAELETGRGGGEAVVYKGVYGDWSVDDNDRQEVALYRGGLTVAAVALFLCTAIGLLSPADAPLSWRVEDLLAFAGAAGLGVSLWQIHIYVSPLKKFVQGLWAVGVASAVILFFKQDTSVVQQVVNNPVTVWGVGPFFAAVTGIAFKEGLCYGKFEAAALFFVTPLLLLGHLTGWVPPGGQKALLVCFTALFSLFAARKYTQKLEDDLGDKSVFEFQKLSEAEQEERVAAIRRQQADQSFPE